MGGKAFGDVRPVKLEEFESTYAQLQLKLKPFGVRLVPIGSSGKKPVMGDLDFAVEYAPGRDDLYEKLLKSQDLLDIRRFGSGQISWRFPLNGTFIQVDLVVGNVRWLEWALYTPKPEESPVTGEIRNIFLNDILNKRAQYAEPVTKIVQPNDRTRLLIDWNVGLFDAKQTNRTGDPSVAYVSWKTIKKTFITDDPDRLASVVFGSSFGASDIKTFDRVVETLKQTDTKAPLLLKDFISTLGYLISQRAINGDAGLVSYIESICT